MFKRIVGAVTVMTVTFSALGMGYPQENETRTEEIAKVLDTTQATELLMEGIHATQKDVATVQTQGARSVEAIADA